MKLSRGDLTAGGRGGNGREREAEERGTGKVSGHEQNHGTLTAFLEHEHNSVRLKLAGRVSVCARVSVWACVHSGKVELT